MRCIAYISEPIFLTNQVLVPSNLSSIYHCARINNAKHNITGVLSYRDGLYFQVIEGDEENVTSLYNIITRDERHSNLQPILNISSTERCFPKWPMKILMATNADPYFQGFVERYKSYLSQLSGETLEKTRVFIDLDHSSQKTDRSYEGKLLSISSWPDFTQVRPSNKTIDLCAQLVNASCSYDNILASYGVEYKSGLNKLLIQLDSLKILKVETEGVFEGDIRHTNSVSGFYSKMKRFLKLIK
jgi:hypothetical protein